MDAMTPSTMSQVVRRQNIGGVTETKGNHACKKIADESVH